MRTKLVLRGLRRAWSDYIDELGGWGMGYNSTLATFELLQMEGVTSDGDPFERLLVDALPDCAWVKRDFFRLSPYDRLKSGWDEFVALVKHRNRYFFSLRLPDDHDIDAMSPLEVLSNLTNALEQAGLTTVWDPGRRVFRARPHATADTPTNAWQLGAVPISLADRAAANRFSAAGIPLFYGASSAKAAEQEARTAASEKPDAITIAEFELRTPLRLVDFSQGIDVPSLFDPDRGDRQPDLAFLDGFLREAVKPVRRDGEEHVAYVPTQVVCEYFRSEYRTSEGQQVDGIVYPSATTPGDTNVVLFVQSDQLENSDGTREPRPETMAWLGPVDLRDPVKLRLVRSHVLIN
jgi:RES domain-containing protein